MTAGFAEKNAAVVAYHLSHSPDANIGEWERQVMLSANEKYCYSSQLRLYFTSVEAPPLCIVLNA